MGGRLGRGEVFVPEGVDRGRTRETRRHQDRPESDDHQESGATEHDPHFWANAYLCVFGNGALLDPRTLKEGSPLEAP
jgi:hypothetical protein